MIRQIDVAVIHHAKDFADREMRVTVGQHEATMIDAVLWADSRGLNHRVRPSPSRT